MSNPNHSIIIIVITDFIMMMIQTSSPQMARTSSLSHPAGKERIPMKKIILIIIIMIIIVVMIMNMIMIDIMIMIIIHINTTQQGTRGFL